MWPKDVFVALEEVMGKSLCEEDVALLKDTISELTEPLSFRTWCGVCAVAERLLPRLPQRDVDPPLWIERADFEALERRLRFADVDEKLASLLRSIRDR